MATGTFRQRQNPEQQADKGRNSKSPSGRKSPVDSLSGVEIFTRNYRPEIHVEESVLKAAQRERNTGDGVFIRLIAECATEAQRITAACSALSRPKKTI